MRGVIEEDEGGVGGKMSNEQDRNSGDEYVYNPMYDLTIDDQHRAPSMESFLRDGDIHR